MSVDEAGVIQGSALDKARRVRMRTPDEVAAMLAHKARGRAKAHPAGRLQVRRRTPAGDYPLHPTA